MRTACRGVCGRNSVPRGRGPMYARGLGWCTTCERWFDKSLHDKCPCCSMVLRCRPRAKRVRSGPVRVQSKAAAAGVHV